MPEAATNTARGDGPADVTAWAADRLIDYLVATHHAYERRAMPEIAHALAELARARSGRRRDLLKAAALFNRLMVRLDRHLMKEERVLFPYIRELAAPANGAAPRNSPFGTIRNPIAMMRREHRDVLGRVRAVRALVRGRGAQARLAAAGAACAEMVLRFEEDLRRHAALEDDVLFPTAVALEALQT